MIYTRTITDTEAKALRRFLGHSIEAHIENFINETIRRSIDDTVKDAFNNADLLSSDRKSHWVSEILKSNPVNVLSNIKKLPLNLKLNIVAECAEGK